MSRPLALAALALLAAGVAASCRDLVSPEPVALVPSLCELLAQCDGGEDWQCPSSVQAPFDALAAEERDEAYGTFLGNDCLTDCKSARFCRDLSPLCAAVGAACGSDRECCGYTGGVGECGGLGACCIPDGAPCSDGGCCEGECENKHCGDFACAPVGEVCDFDLQCCSKRCEAGACAPNTCSITGGACEVAGDCCDPEAACTAGECTTSNCEDGCNPNDLSNCCVTEGLGLCFLLLSGKTTCAEETCIPAGVECGGDIDCRCLVEGGVDLLCDDAAFPHCAVCRGFGATCDPSSADDGCCAGACNADTGTCMP